MDKEQILKLAGEPIEFEQWAQPILGDNPNWRESGPAELARQAWRAARKPLEVQLAEFASMGATEACAKIPAVFEYVEGLEKQLSAAQLQIQQYLEALEIVGIAPLVSDHGLPKYGISVSEMKTVQKALALSADTSALQAIVKKAGEVTLEDLQK